MTLTAQQKLEIVKRALSGEEVTRLAYDYGLARKTIYDWINKYKEAANRSKTESLAQQYRSGSAHYAYKRSGALQGLRRLVYKNPEWGSRRYADELQVSYATVLEMLKDLGWETEDKRRNLQIQYAGPGRLTINKKENILRNVLSGQKTVTQVAQEENISRKAVYQWLNEYKSEGSAGIKERYICGRSHPRAVIAQAEDKILGLVAAKPDMSIRQLQKEAAVSTWSVWKVLDTNNLRTYQQRADYAARKAVVEMPTDRVLAPVTPDRVRSVWEGQIPSVLPAPPPAAWLNSLRFGVVGAVLGIGAGLAGWGLVSAITANSTAGGQLGALMAYIALACGMGFMVYSFKYYITIALVLSYSQGTGVMKLVWDQKRRSKRLGVMRWLLGESAATKAEDERGGTPGLLSDIDQVRVERYPMVSVQIPFYNEKNVAIRAITAAMNLDYPEYEIIAADDSTDETTQIILEYMNNLGNVKTTMTNDQAELKQVEVRPGLVLKHLHRTSRAGFKGGALALALQFTHPNVQFVSVFDADFVPYQDALTSFVKYFKISNNMTEDYTKSNIAAVQGYQWHVLNKSENWITRGVRTEYSGSYVIERAGEELYGGLKQISGSVYMIRRDVLEKIGWGNSITEDFELTLKLYAEGFKVVYTPYVQAPAECVSTLKRLIRQRMRWAEGHSFNIRRRFKQVLFNDKLTGAEKAEFLYLAPYYLQAAFFLIGTLSWLVSEVVFHASLPFWTAVWGWSLVMTNMLALPLMNGVGLFLEEGEQKDYAGLASFVLLSYLVVPFQAYAAVKGFIEKEEGPWFRTPKTGRITDILARSRFYRFISGILPGFKPSLGSVQSLAFSVQLPKVRKGKWVNGVVAGMMLVVLGLQLVGNTVATAEAAQQGMKLHKPENRANTETDVKTAMVKTTKTTFGDLKTIYYQEPKAELSDGKHRLIMNLAGSNLGEVHRDNVTKTDERIVYNNIFEGVDMMFNLKLPENVQEGIVMKKPVDLTYLDYSIYLEGLKPESDQGTVKFVDTQTGEKVFGFGAPYLYEAHNDRELIPFEVLSVSDIKFSFGVDYTLRKSPVGWVLRKQLNKDGKGWLNDPQRKFPVVLDPTVVVSGTIATDNTESRYGSLQRKLAYVSGNWYAFFNDVSGAGTSVWYKKSTDGGASWGSAIDVNSVDTDNWNPTVWVKGTKIWVAWIDDTNASGDTIEFRSIDTSSDTLGTLTTCDDRGAVNNTFTASIAVQNTGTAIYAAITDTSGGSAALGLWKVTTEGTCSSTQSISTSSTLTAGDQPILITKGDDLIFVSQDGQLSYSYYKGEQAKWASTDNTLASVTDSVYSVATDGNRIWVLSVSGTTATNFYQIEPKETVIDATAGANRMYVDIDCVGGATDCKMFYIEQEAGEMTFVDCNDATCSAPAITITGLDTGSTANGIWDSPVAMACPSATTCLLVYYDAPSDDLTYYQCNSADCTTLMTTAPTADFDTTVGGRPNTVDVYCVSASDCDILYTQSDISDLTLFRCSNAVVAGTSVCNTLSAAQVINADVGLNGGASSMYCPTSADCKIVYQDISSGTGVLKFADCNAAPCNSGTLDATSTIDTDVGKIYSAYSAIDCVAGAGECRVAYYDGTDGDITFADCGGAGTDPDCSPAVCGTPTNCVDVDTDVGLLGAPVALDCNSNAGQPDDCKIFYDDATSSQPRFVDCNDNICSSTSIQTVGTGEADLAFVALSCAPGVTDCKLAYSGLTSEGVRFVDCNDTDCDTPSGNRVVNTAPIYGAMSNQEMYCPSVTNCKIVYYDIPAGIFKFVDCDDATCTTRTTTNINSSVGRNSGRPDIYCLTSSDCKIVYYDDGTGILKFVDCDSETCASPATTSLDTTMGGTVAAALDCAAAATDCKVVYFDTAASARDIVWLDCNDASCSTTGGTRLIDTEDGGQDGGGIDIDCSIPTAGSDCRIVYTDGSNSLAGSGITYIDCTSATTCCAASDCAGAGEKIEIDTAVGSHQADSEIDCVGGSADCKILFYDLNDQDATFVDCAQTTTTCDTPTTTDVDAAVGNGNDMSAGMDLDCVSATTCRWTYFSFANDVYKFVQCEDGDCNAPTTNLAFLIGTGANGGGVGLDCGSDAADCKVVLANTNDGGAQTFLDCLAAACVNASLTVPYTGQTNLTFVSISYDTTNDKLYAHVLMDASNQAWWESTDSSTISWTAKTSYAFTVGSLAHISSNMAGAGTDAIAVVVRQNTNFEFSKIPERWEWLVLSMLPVALWILKKRKR